MIDQSVLNFNQLIFLGPLIILIATILILIVVDIISRMAGG